MTLGEKITAGLASAGVIGASSLVGLDQACIFDAEVLEIEDQKVCFEQAPDYKLYKDSHIAEYEKEGNLYLYGENGSEFMAIINHEYGKNKFNLNGVHSDTDFIEQVILNIK